MLHLVLPRRVDAERVAGGVDSLLVQHDQLLGDLSHRAAHRHFAFAKSLPPRRCSDGASPPTYWRSAVDLVAGHVQLVAALVVQQQVVALGPADRALDHSLVLADAVLVVHDVVAGLEVLEQAGALALARPRLDGACVGDR